MNRDEKRGRASSFSEVADAYERARPGYPEDAVRWLAGGEPHDVVDLGAGTGKLTRSLAALGHRVTAVEPLPAMLAHLRRAVPGARALEGGAEAIPLPDASTDVVTVAQAFHWFDQPVALREIARVLRPGGRLALVWNVRDDRQPWMAELSEAMGSESVRDGDGLTAIAASGLYGPVERASFALTQRLTGDELRDLVLSRSYCAVRTPEERAPVLAAVDSLFAAHGDGTTIELSYVTECFRAAVGSGTGSGTRA